MYTTEWHVIWQLQYLSHEMIKKMGLRCYLQISSDDNLYWMCGLSKRGAVKNEIPSKDGLNSWIPFLLRRGTLAEASYRSADVKSLVWIY